MTDAKNIRQFSICVLINEMGQIIHDYFHRDKSREPRKIRACDMSR